MASLHPQVEGDGTSEWARPLINIVKVSVDAAVFEDRGEVGFVMITMDSDGILIEATRKFQTQVVAPVLDEAMAIKEALSWIDRAYWTHMILETDFLVVVQAIRIKTPMRSNFGLVIKDCRSLMQRLHTVSLFFVKQSANMVAHALARGSYDLSGHIFDRSSVYIEIQNCIDMDLSI